MPARNACSEMKAINRNSFAHKCLAYIRKCHEKYSKPTDIPNFGFRMNCDKCPFGDAENLVCLVYDVLWPYEPEE